MKNVKGRFRRGRNYLLIALVFFIAACTTFLDDEKYTGLPHSLRYMPVDSYRIGDDYVSATPTVMGGENAVFEIASVEGPSPDEVLNASFAIDAQNGNINIKEYCQLLPGDYSLDIQVTNPAGTEVFADVFNFSAVQVAPDKLRYIPSLYSFYSTATGDMTAAASVNGGGPYVFTMDDPLNYFTINELTGEITKEAIVEIGDDDKLLQTFDVSVSNEMGTHTESKAVTIEIIGANVGKVAYNAEYNSPNAVNLGLVNSTASTFAGTYSATVNGEEYTTELSQSINGPVYKGNRHTNTWHATSVPVVMDVSGNGEQENSLFLSFKTSTNTTECVSIVVSDPIDLNNAQSAYAEIVAYKRYIDNDFNQQFALLVCDDEQYNSDDAFATEWTVMSENIAPGMLPYSNPISESKLTEGGTQAFNIPGELTGKKVRLALKAVHLNPELGKIGREAFVYKWQVRAMY
ncbi:hypothetical protein [Carboxylicivirga sp. RSCT41]|uniref:hypothetical protein n=1 Tax=Carboxylicivirga agarovorans TaxID=3417570 RepID=UPI003D34BFC5